MKWTLGLAALGIVVGSVLVFWLMRASVRAVTLPEPTGPYPVGRTCYDWIDASRQELFAPTPAASGKQLDPNHGTGPHLPKRELPKRELMVWIWYPADPPPGLKPGAYLPGRWGAELERARGQYLWQSFATIQAHSFTGAPLSRSQPGYPILIFSTGSGRVPTDYTVLMEDLASHGYVVAGIANPYSAPLAVFADGRVARRNAAGAIPKGPDEAEAKAADKLVMVWASDVTFVMNRLENMENDPSSPFYQLLDINRLGLLGHSFGGAVAAEACSIDSRCRASLALDGWLCGDVVRVGLNQPFMDVRAEGPPSRLRTVLLTLERLKHRRAQPGDSAAGEATEAVYQRSPDGYAVAIRGAGTFNFTDSGLLFSPIARLTGRFRPVESRRILEITSAYVRAFFDRYLNNASSPLLEGPSGLFPEVELREHVTSPPVLASPGAPTTLGVPGTPQTTAPAPAAVP